LQKQSKKLAGNNLKEIEVFDVYEGKGIDESKKSLAYSLTFSSNDKTLTDEEINPLLDKIVENVKKEYNAELRS
jgi:phenylalanyl-tRNA synthetase beta chain